mmetsp:Transcript_94357/g.149214  ORF Transcript_94357/g.149214 Transcript_94357/m.149214 type:complete len:383 (+) Transcript_94357:100-1248(+)
MPQSTVPYIGSKISLISNSEIRYEGILYTINTQESTIALQSVRCFGTEGRKMPEIPPSSEVYDFIIFRGQDIKDLTVLEACNAVNDPAIVSINQRPAGGKAEKGEKGGAQSGGGKADSKGGRSKGGGNQAISNMFSSAKSGGRKGDDYGSSGQKGWGRDTSNDGWGSSWWSTGRDSGWSSSWGGGKDYGWSSGSYGKGSGSGQKGWGGETQKGSKAQKGGKSADSGKGKGKTSGKASKGTDKGSGSGNTGGRRGGGAATTGVPVGELVPEDNAEAKKEFAEEFDYGASNDKFDKVTTSEGVDGLEDRLKPLKGYDKSKSFFDEISCEATERANDNDRQKVDRDKARQFDRETFGDTRRPPRPTGGRPGKGRRRGGAGKGGFR